ncbi:cyclopropane-fatty-acyl-phospholipid synthase [Sporomusaceae bacterium BoRhaA]|uniref:SAM-dependent methyltransferase n=1 Tax=Pelorhabdus rhamnosifermentans TaxID=2772457 RepID=UPI001C060C18|nr:cyclopropane-fatty-acyl-phospholipid synthase family protein [Pelorhabdus rhamnosifermentans]MBU2699645.1 cyclopropane-fatty-acyl-phospholipid synthase [Pelorhabdus rhamnosifermentans]
MKKVLIDAMFKHIQYGGVAVRYWDGEEVHYGDTEPHFKIIFNKKPPLMTATIEDPTITLGEFYMDEIIDYEGSLDELISIMEMNKLLNSDTQHLANKWMTAAKSGLGSVADKFKQRQNIHAHYDLGNDFFSLWLDKTMCYSCAYFKKQDDDLHLAQLQKIDLILKKLRLQPGMQLLDIGCGWGWLILRAAKQYGVRALGITLSEEQYAGARKRVEEAGLSDQVTVKLSNYLEIDPAQYQFDRIVSVGMFEHVGRDYFASYMKKVHDLLNFGGISMLHTLTNLREVETNAWAKKYIFPGGCIPALREIISLFPDYDFRVWHMESLRRHYVKTLELWYENFHQHIDEISGMFDKRFIRMWTLYLQGAAAILRTGNLDVYQILFSKGVNNELPITLNDIYVD